MMRAMEPAFRTKVLALVLGMLCVPAARGAPPAEGAEGHPGLSNLGTDTQEIEASPFRDPGELRLFSQREQQTQRHATSPFRDPGELRLGFSFGGISFVGLLLEQRWGTRSVELNLGTWAFRDLSVSLVAKQYYGPGDFRPYSGVGLWGVLAAPPAGPEEQQGFALLLRAPVGVEWNLDAGHHVGADLALNRALRIRRKDPRDETPPSSRLVPLPGFHYRWKR